MGLFLDLVAGTSFSRNLNFVIFLKSFNMFSIKYLVITILIQPIYNWNVYLYFKFTKFVEAGKGCKYRGKQNVGITD